MSTTFCPYSITAAMNQIPGSWTAIGDKQRYFLETLYFPDEAGRVEGMRGLITNDCGALNTELREAGFDFQFGPFTGQALLGLFALQAQWIEYETSKITILAANGRHYKGAMLEPDYHKNSHIFCGWTHHPNPVVDWRSSDGLWTFYITEADQERGGMDLLQYVAGLKFKSSKNIDGLRFPICSITDHPDISWLAGIRDALGGHVETALQENKLLLDEKGVEIKSATVLIRAYACAGFSPPPEIITIKRPYYFWACHAQCSVPVFAAYVDYDAWTLDENAEQEKEAQREWIATEE